MITGCGVWNVATTKDQRFAAYIHNPDIIRSTHPISKGASEIFKRIFHLNPLSRITLAELREEIVKLDTLFMSEEELMVASEDLRKTAMFYRSHRPPSNFVVGEDSSSGETLYGLDLDDEDPEEQYLFPSPDPNAAFILPTPRIISPTHEDPPIEVILRTLHLSNSESTLHSESGNSEADSEGPITPETHALDPSTDVPDFAEGEGMDQSVVYAKEPFNSWMAKAPSIHGIFQAAVQRFRGLRMAN